MDTSKQSCYSIGVIAVWIGPLLNYFPLWWRTAAANSGIDFHLLTDQEVPFSASNITVHRVTLDGESIRFSSALGEDIRLTRAYKFCDFKPLYGVVYQDILSGYDFWGYCDLDVVFGNIRTFVTDDVLSAHDIIYRTGQLCLYRNVERINRLWEADGALYTREELFDPQTNCGFDEFYGIMQIAASHGLRIYEGSVPAQGQAGFTDREKSLYAVCRQNYPRQVFYWSDGRAYHRWIGSSGELCEDEVILMHFMGGRKLVYDQACLSAPAFCVSAEEGFSPLEKAPLREDINYRRVPSGFERSILGLFNTLRRFIAAPPADRKVKRKRYSYWFRSRLGRGGR